MARNIEIKARLQDIDAVAKAVAAFADDGPTRIEQDDTFFACANGRLKLRAFSAQRGELIFYRRADEAGPKESFYVIAPRSAPDALREALTLAYPKFVSFRPISRPRRPLTRMDAGFRAESEM